jgi:hypothetical protein
MNISYMKGEKATKVGFVVQSMIREDLLPTIDNRIRKRIPSHLRWHFDIVAVILLGPQQTSVKALFIMSSELVATELVPPLDSIFNQTKMLNFYPWTNYISLKPEQKSTIINRQLNFHENYHSLVFTGITEFEKNLRVFDPPTKCSESNKRKTSDPTDSIAKNEAENPKDTIMLDTDNITVLQMIKKEFKNNAGNEIFTKVYKPSKGNIEVILHKYNFVQTRKINNRAFLNAIATVIPTNRHNLIFQDPTKVSTCGPSPNILL